MNTLKEIGLLNFGTSIVMSGVIFRNSQTGDSFTAMFPGFELPEESQMVEFSVDDWQQVLQQTDFQNVEVGKAIIRKSQRQIDNRVSWAVYERDEYKCRYCGKRGPLTVDHVAPWEDGGPTIPFNLLSACPDCNRTRGRTPYKEWLESPECVKRSKGLDAEVIQANIWVVFNIPEIEKLRVPLDKIRSR
jgi:hypothetical protein